MKRFLVVCLSLLFLVTPALGQTSDDTSSESASTLALYANGATVLALFAAGWQLFQSNRQHRENARRSAAEKAIEIAKLFQSEIIDEMTYIILVLGLIGQLDLYEQSKSLKRPNLRFTKEEFTELFGETAADTYHKCQSKISLSILHAARFEFHSPNANAPQSSMPRELRSHIEDAQAMHQFTARRANLLNTLEWVAILINTHVASEETIYQSLHQAFLRYVRAEYPTIALQNSDHSASDQYYTNVILLYRRWERRWMKARMADINAKQKHQRMRDRNVKYAPHV